MKKTISILGSTGSIGTQTLEVVRNNPDLQVAAISGNKNIELLAKQILEFSPKLVCVYDENQIEVLQKKLREMNIDAIPKIVSGMDGLVSVATFEQTNIVVTAIVGMVGIRPTMEAIKAGKDIALANKETLVCAGELIMAEAKKQGIHIYPVDSEHSAIFQSLNGENRAEIDKIMSDLFPSYVPNMRPVYASSILRTVTQVHQMSLTGIGSPFVSIDYYVHEKSQQAGKTIHSLEPRSLQDSIIARMRAANASKSATLRDQMMSFYVLCKTTALRIDNSLQNRMLYSRGQGLQIVQNTVSNSDYLRNVTKTIMNGFSNDESVNLMAVKERNALWMKKIPTLMKAEPTLFVVGIAHLYPYRDSKGLLADLRKKGYKIRQLEAPKAQLKVIACDDKMKKSTYSTFPSKSLDLCMLPSISLNSPTGAFISFSVAFSALTLVSSAFTTSASPNSLKAFQKVSISLFSSVSTSCATTDCSRKRMLRSFT